MKFTDHIEHYCIKGALLNVHRPPEYVTCGNADCGQGASGEHKFHLVKETAKKIGIDLKNPKCPKCDSPMVDSGPQHFGELHLEVCLDSRVHMPQWRSEGKITEEEYQTWVASLTERELNGYFEQKIHRTAVKLDHREVDLFESDPVAFFKEIEPKIESRLELDAQFQIPHRYASRQHDVKHHLENFKGGKV